MKIIIGGAGAVGTHLSKLLSKDHQDCVLIDEYPERLAGLDNRYDIMTLLGSPTSIKTLKEAGIVSLVDGAIAEKKLSSEKKAEFVELGKQIGHAGLKKVLDAMHPMVKLSGVVNGASQVSTTYTKLSEVPESELLRLRAEDPTRYKALYKAEYGMDCEV